MAGDRAEVAEFPCEGEGSENLYYHEDLISRLRDAYPELAEVGFSDVEAGWLTQSGDEAFLYIWALAPCLSDEDTARVGRAMSEWCRASGVRKLTIADASRRDDGGEPGEDSWELP